MRFNREGLDVMGRSPAAGAAENNTSTPKTAAARRAAEAAEALLRDKVGVISDAEQAEVDSTSRFSDKIPFVPVMILALSLLSSHKYIGSHSDDRGLYGRHVKGVR